MDKSSLIITQNSQIQKHKIFVFAGKGMIMQIPLQLALWMKSCKIAIFATGRTKI